MVEQELIARFEAKIDKLMESQQRLSTEFLLMRSGMESDFKVFGHRLAGVEARVGSLEHDAADTGIHNLEELKKRAERAEEHKWSWVKLAVIVFATIAGSSGATAGFMRFLAGH